MLSQAFRACLSAAAVLVLCLPAGGGEEYLPGGPLAGVKLPPYPTQHGEPPGHPGCIPPGDGAPAETFGLAPERHLYPGSVEHWRAYWFKYCPTRSFFDRQSQVKNFLAAELAGIDPRRVEKYAEPVYRVGRHDRPENTGRRNRPVAVVRCSAGRPVFRLDLGRLEPGLYAVRVIGAVETETLRPFLRPAFVGMRVNDRPDGGQSRYRIRIGYVDEFYGIAEVYFHAPAERRYRAELWFDKGTDVDVLVRNISLDDVLAGCERRAIKRRALSLHLPDELAEIKGDYHPNIAYKRFRAAVAKGDEPRPDPDDRDERWRRDATIWQGLPHANCQVARTRTYNREATIGEDDYGVGGKSLTDIRIARGRWEVVHPHNVTAPLRAEDLRNLPRLLRHKELGIEYTMADLAAGRTLPDPYPHKADGTGIYTPDPNNPAKGQVFWPAGAAIVGERQGFAAAYLDVMNYGSTIWLAHRDETCARDAAVALLRFAYLFPTFDTCRSLEAVTTDCWIFNRILLRRRLCSNRYYGNFIRFTEPLFYYDRLYGAIAGNEDLARSVSRFVPWVKSSEDLVELLDVYLVQTMAKRILRYQYYGDGRQPWRITEPAMCLADNAFTEPWMRWLFRRTFFYPQPLAGIQDYAIAGTDRDGRSPIGSFSYMIGEFSADSAAATLEKYIRLGGDKRWDLRDPKVLPKIDAAVAFYFRSRTAGLAFPRIGDVAGPDKQAWQYFDTVIDRAPTFWRWTKDPRWAWVTARLTGRRSQSDAEWQAIEAAAATVRRAPWLDNRSRVLPGWGAFLERGVEHDDYRFRQSTMIRLGHGAGHAHSDGMDLQLHAHGLPVTVDGGQRGGYSDPGDRHTCVHNTVEVDGRNWQGHSWAAAMTDAPPARYVRCRGIHVAARELFSRQVALVGVDDGANPAAKVTPRRMGPDPAGLPTEGVVTPNAYTFDCFRVAGGDVHTYAFHATVNDPGGPQPTTNARDFRAVDPKKPPAGAAGEAVRHVGHFPAGHRLGTCPEVLTVTFPMVKFRQRHRKDQIAAGSEKHLRPKGDYRSDGPGTFTRWHVLGADGLHVLRADQHCTRWHYWIPHFFVQRRGKDLSTAFAAVIEPYVGRPFITSARELPVADNEADARRAVAVAVRTRNGHRDLCFADGRPGRTRRVGEVEIAAEYAFLSSDANGLRAAILTGGTVLRGPRVRIAAATPERRAKVLRVDYPARRVWIDAAWPAEAGGRVVEIGDVSGRGRKGYLTSFTASAVRPEGEGTRLTMLRSAACYRSRIESVDPEARTVTCALNLPGTKSGLGGMDRGFVAGNDEGTKRWRVERSEGARTFTLAGPDVREEDFAAGGALRLWEYGVGDEVRTSTSVVLRRIGPGVYELGADVPCTVALPAAGIELSTAGKPWRPAGRREGTWARVEIEPGTVRLRAASQ